MPDGHISKEKSTRVVRMRVEKKQRRVALSTHLVRLVLLEMSKRGCHLRLRGVHGGQCE